MVKSKLEAQVYLVQDGNPAVGVKPERYVGVYQVINGERFWVSAHTVETNSDWRARRRAIAAARKART